MSTLHIPARVRADIGRPLSHSERWYWILDQISPLNVVAWVTVSGHVTSRQLHAAAAAVVAAHPLLRVGIQAQPDGTRPCFVPLAHPSLPIRALSRDELDGEAATREIDTVELATRIPTSGSLARLVDIATAVGTARESHDLILTMAHAISDGTSILSLLREIVEHAAVASTGETITDGPMPASRPAQPSVDARLPAAARGAMRIAGSMLADQVIAAGARPVRLKPEHVVAPADRRTRLLTREISGADLEDLVTACRRRGVTVHGAITAATAVAAAREVAAGRTVRMPVGSPMNFRAELGVDDRELGSFVATVTAHPKVGGDTDFWRSARSVNRVLLRRKRFRQHLIAIGSLRWLCPDSVARSGRVVELIESRGPWNVCMTNIGRYEFPDRVGGWRVSGAQFAAGISCIGHFVSAVSTAHGVLHWNSTYVDGVMSADRAGRIADAAVAGLLAQVRAEVEGEVHD